MPFDAPRVAFGQPSTAPPARTKGMVRRMAQAKLAAQCLPTIPEPGESVHTIMGSNYDLGQVVCAVVARHPVEHLRVATLAYSKRTMAELFERADKKRIGTLTVLVSVFFAAHNKDLFDWVTAEMGDYPGSRQAAVRSHCKIVLFEFADGSCPLTFEGSANLRKNGDREQLTAIRDRAVHDWHAEWMDNLVNENG